MRIPQSKLTTNQGDITLKKPSKFLKLEAIRGFAAIYVAVGHIFIKNLKFYGHDFSFIFRFGQEAVILFFLLSGFVIQYSFSLSKDQSFRLFFMKRCTRIYIPLFFIFALNYIIYIYTNINPAPISKWNFAGNILMLQDASILKPNVICDCFLGNLPLWSLSYEWWFYILFFIINARIKGNVSLFSYLVSIIAAITYIIYPNFFNRELMYLAIWWVGADIAKLYLCKQPISFKSLSLQLIILASITIILCFNIIINYNPNATIGTSPYLEFRHFAFALLAVVIAVRWKEFQWFAFDQTIGLFTFIAPISFGIYISHWFLVADAHYLDGLINNIFIKTIAYISICIIFSYFIERILYVHLSDFIFKKFKVQKQIK